MERNNQLSFEMLSDDIRYVKQSYSSWELSQSESPIDFIERKKSIDLVDILNDVIENELTKSQQHILNMFYFDCMTIAQIAEKLNIYRSSVKRQIDCIDSKIYSNLKYTVMYKYQNPNEDIVPIAIRQTFSMCAVKASNPSSIGGRFLRLKTLSNLSFDEISKGTQIEKSKLKNIEKGHYEISATEAVSLASFFNVSTDYLLTGKN